MGTYVKMKHKRDNWKKKAVEVKTESRYQRKEIKRIKHQRNLLKKELQLANETTNALKNKNKTLQINDKTDLVFLVLQFFLTARIGYRAISRVLAVLAPYLGLSKTPCTQTIINWVNRHSIAKMKYYLAPIDQQLGISLFSGGVIFILDASIGLGKGKIMTVLALDVKHHLLNKGAPTLENVQCVAVSVASSWTGESIADLLERIIAVTGKPLGYLKDGGTDLSKSVRLLDERGNPSLSIDDISHFIANLLKHEFQKHPHFEIFIQTCGKASKMFKQTLLACLAPPKVTTKARFMNLHRLVKWASQILEHSPKGRAPKDSLLEKLRKGFTQMPHCKSFIKDFLQNASPLLECQKLLKTKGLSRKSYAQSQLIAQTISNDYIRIEFNKWLDKHLIIAISLGLDGVGMPISSDCIESLFGVVKHHGAGQTKDANRLAQHIPAFCGKPTRQDAVNALSISVKEEQKAVGAMPSLIRQRREVLSHRSSLEMITLDDAKPNMELIVGSKTG